MATSFATYPSPATLTNFQSPSRIFSSLLFPRGNIGQLGIAKTNPVSAISLLKWSSRRTLVCAVNQDAEESFKKTLEVDRLIDALSSADDKELQNLVIENVLAFDASFWIRLAARSDLCTSEDDKRDYEELASSVMRIVDRLVNKTNEKIESSTDVLKELLKPVVEVEEIAWPPRDPEALNRMEEEVNQREQEGKLDEGFLSEVNAQLRQAKEDGDKPGLVAMLQKVFQLYASKVLSRRSYAKKGTEVLKDEQLLEEIIKGTFALSQHLSKDCTGVGSLLHMLERLDMYPVYPLTALWLGLRARLFQHKFFGEPNISTPEGEWSNMLINGMTIGKGDISPEALNAVIKKRIDRTLIRTEGGSYQQRILIEYLKGIQSRAEEISRILQGKSQ